MSNVVISGYYGSKNGGDEAMLAAMLEVFSDIDPKVNITVISSCPEDTRARHEVDSVSWLDFPGIFGALRKADLLISGGGSLLQNVTSRRSLYYYLVIIWLAMVAGAKVMLYAQGIGPIQGSFPRKLMSWLGNKVDLITVRDHGSIKELADLGITRPHIEETADPVLAIHKVDCELGRKILEYNAVLDGRPLVGISVREWCNWSHYKDVLAKAADRISDELGARVVFLPMQYPDDVKAAEIIAAKTHCDAVVLNADYNTSELLSIVGNMDLLIAVRLHALIFAGVMGVPMIGLSYDPKIDRFVECLGERPVGNLDDVDLEKLMEAVHHQWDNKKSFRVKNTKLFADLKNLAVKNAKLAVKVINE